ncbi:MAG: hypothetical protein QMC89_05320 [Candidatus Hodarchaeaceae archaeon]|nr:hypothetical protein [Candidatus Hodarchaeaceae archaeon]
MRTEKYKRGFTSILLVSALLLSMVFIATPVLAPALVGDPTGTTITVGQGGFFVVRFTLRWDRPENGVYSLPPIVWDSPRTNDAGTPDNNLTFVSARAYFISGDNVGENVEALWDYAEGAHPEDPALWRHSVSVYSTTPDPRNGDFNVEIVLRAAGAGGVPHIIGTHMLSTMGLSVDIAEGPLFSYSTAADWIAVNIVSPWPGPGVIARGKANAYGTSRDATPPAYKLYVAGEYPPIVAAQRVGSGVVIASGLTSTLDNGRWNKVGSPCPYFDRFLHAAIQWAKPGATKILWDTGYGTYNRGARVKDLRDALTALGYTVTEDNTQLKGTGIIGENDVLLVAGYQLGARWSGGDPTLLPSGYVDNISSWVSAGGVLLIFNNSDYFGYNFYRVQNKILRALGFGWCFQSDQILDPVDNYAGAAYYPILAVDTTTGIGSDYLALAGTSDLGVYSITSLVEWPTFGVSVLISPDRISRYPGTTGENVYFTVTVNNTGTGWDNYTLSASDNRGWSLGISPTKLLVLAGGSGTATLRVEIPDEGTAPPCTEDLVTVTATGTESFWDPVSASDNAIAHSGFPYDVDLVSISPSHQSGRPGETLSYDVVVKNIGGIEDNLLLSASDTQGWTLVLAPGRFDGVEVGGERTAALEVTIPGDAIPGTIDNITVMVTSEGDSTKSDSEVCRAQVALLRSVDVVIEEPRSENAILVINKEWSGKRYDPLSFKVRITNTGSLDDKYVLSVREATGKELGLEIMPPELFIAAGESDIAELSVTVPDNAKGSTTYTIVVRAEGQLASGTDWDPDNVSDSDEATVQVQEARGVRVDILTQDQTGTPESTLVWIIRVKNLGNVDDNYNLSLYQRVWDNNRDYDNWYGEIEDNRLEVPACSIGQARLKLTIPSGLRTGVRNDIVVTATSENYSAITDNDDVTAFVLVPGPRIPQAWAKVTVEAEVKAIELWPTTWDIGVLDETEIAKSDNFTVRNVGNVDVRVDIIGSDAKSAPGEPVTSWTLAQAIGVDTYAMKFDNSPLLKTPSTLATLAPSQEYTFVLTLQAPGVITVPSRMWTIVTLRAY